MEGLLGQMRLTVPEHEHDGMLRKSVARMIFDMTSLQQAGLAGSEGM